MEMICPKAKECGAGNYCEHAKPHELIKKSKYSCEANEVCPSCISVPEVKEPLLLSDEQRSAHIYNSGVDFDGMLKAQHAKSVKAVFEVIDKLDLIENSAMAQSSYEALKTQMLEEK